MSTNYEVTEDERLHERASVLGWIGSVVAALAIAVAWRRRRDSFSRRDFRGQWRP